MIWRLRHLEVLWARCTLPAASQRHRVNVVPGAPGSPSAPYPGSSEAAAAKFDHRTLARLQPGPLSSSPHLRGLGLAGSGRLIGSGSERQPCRAAGRCSTMPRGSPPLRAQVPELWVSPRPTSFRAFLVLAVHGG